jgi:hypothetical protein
MSALRHHASHQAVDQWSVRTDKLSDHWAQGPFTFINNNQRPRHAASLVSRQVTYFVVLTLKQY